MNYATFPTFKSRKSINPKLKFVYLIKFCLEINNDFVHFEMTCCIY